MIIVPSDCLPMKSYVEWPQRSNLFGVDGDVLKASEAITATVFWYTIGRVSHSLQAGATSHIDCVIAIPALESFVRDVMEVTLPEVTGRGI